MCKCDDGEEMGIFVDRNGAEATGGGSCIGFDRMARGG